MLLFFLGALPNSDIIIQIILPGVNYLISIDPSSINKNHLLEEIPSA